MTFAAIEYSADEQVSFLVLQEAYKLLNREIEIVSGSSAELIRKSSSGTFDGELQRIDGLSRVYPSLVQVPVPVNVIQAEAFSLRSDLKVGNWEDLIPLRVGFIDGMFLSEQNLIIRNHQKAPDYRTLMRWLVDGEIDVAVMPRLTGLSLIRELNLSQIHDSGTILQMVFLYHYLHQKHDALLPQISQILETMIKNGRTREIREQYIQQHEFSGVVR
ncbi:transporter substrate-binding domain-containing protein [Shewanella acanthi]|uniref:transporter substrate-binding domain-containing protein n=1 Tax=Shewanella acanthi TaxID=2864212 RepID=UPI001C6583A7|nr:transporter substrate-binding domain-containing protein [Shewanella acanthi]QYJ78930.1 transporter substrate-binding domain-containing protein [Shewanella acanthi]